MGHDAPAPRDDDPLMRRTLHDMQRPQDIAIGVTGYYTHSSDRPTPTTIAATSGYNTFGSDACGEGLPRGAFVRGHCERGDPTISL